MKYMGSKRSMLQNGLGLLLDREVASASRFVDLFTGSGAVATFVAQKHSVPVLAYDLQKYSAVLTDAIIARDTAVEPSRFWPNWLSRAGAIVAQYEVPEHRKITQAIVKEYRQWCAGQRDMPITVAYGGHYFSPAQSVWIDALRITLPGGEPAATVGLAALIQAASQCAAAPGHTAQPFQPTRTAKPFLQEAWSRSIDERTKAAFRTIAATFAKKPGMAQVADANAVVSNLREGDLVFIDPPYSGVHYSRFYHVLETIAQGECGEVSGVGRYPAPSERPRSQYSLKTESSKALNQLLQTLASREASAILTFPDHECSNGLSGDAVREIAGKHFHIEEQIVKSTFSTLGGTKITGEDEVGRAARHHAEELILVLRPTRRKC